MTLDEYDKLRRKGSYDDPREIACQPNAASEMHTHDKESFVFVCEG